MQLYNVCRVNNQASDTHLLVHEGPLMGHLVVELQKVLAYLSVRFVMLVCVKPPASNEYLQRQRQKICLYQLTGIDIEGVRAAVCHPNLLSLIQVSIHWESSSRILLILTTRFASRCFMLSLRLCAALTVEVLLRALSSSVHHDAGLCSSNWKSRQKKGSINQQARLYQWPFASWSEMALMR